MLKACYLALFLVVIAGILISPGLNGPGSANKELRGSMLEQMARQIMPDDQPQEAQEFFALKGAPDGISPIPVERYLRGIRKARRMPQYSTARDAMLPSEEQTRKTGAVAPEFLGSWTQLGPGNIGGRTRAIVI